MIWFRSNGRPCAQLALFALMVQMLVAFGHLHRDDLGLPPLTAADQAHVKSASIPVPADQQRAPASDDYCPICASMALVATALFSLPPILIVPTSISRAWSPQMAVASAAANCALSFQARAPPLV
jgi:hypothetical protein